ncbi:phage tail protein [Celerinatantimonas sp. MCCC 1A17872]|uniref:phage tail protein n=1 Tax=Celerinatantimonas sp. MCCC 1A17872 TaxID=3177514 RepID=UPI0038C6F403
MLTQNLKTVVTLGGSVDSSFTKLGSTFNKSMGTANKTVKELTRDQKKLATQIKRSKLAGADVSLLARRYESLGQEIEQATERAQAFGQVRGIGAGFKCAAKWGATTIGTVWGTAAALTGLMSVTNQETAAMAGLAHSQSMSVEQFQAWNAIAKQADLTGENIGDMIEELSNKYGEFKALGSQSTVSDVFGKLGITKDMMAGMDAAQQFEYVMKRLQHVKDQQQAASLADMLFGGEANKVITYIRSTHKGLDELLQTQSKLNLLTNQGAAGATRYGNAFKNLRTVVGSGWQEISGIVGGEMVGDLNQLNRSIVTFVQNNKTQLVGFVKSLVYGAKDAAVAMFHLGQTINHLVQIMGGWQTVGIAMASLLAGKLVLGLFNLVTGLWGAAKALGVAKGAMAAFNLVMKANPIGLVITAVGGLIFAGVELYRHWDTVVGWFHGALKWFESAFSKTFGVIQSVISWSPMATLQGAWGGMTDYFSGLWSGVSSGFSQFWALAKRVFGWSPLGLIIDNWGGISGFFSGFWSHVVHVFQVGWRVVKALFGWTPMADVQTSFQPLTQYFEKLRERITGIFQKGLAMVKGALGTVKSWVGKLQFWKKKDKDDNQTPEKPQPPVSALPKVGASVRRTSKIPATVLAGTLAGATATAINPPTVPTVTDGAQRAKAAIQQASKTTQVSHIRHVSVGGITVVAAPGQSPAEVGDAVYQRFAESQDDALYDLPES